MTVTFFLGELLDYTSSAQTVMNVGTIVHSKEFLNSSSGWTLDLYRSWADEDFSTV